MRRRTWSPWLPTSCPSTRTRPASGKSRPESTFISVVLPAPFGPSSPKISPAWISSVLPSSTSLARDRLDGAREVERPPELLTDPVAAFGHLPKCAAHAKVVDEFNAVAVRAEPVGQVAVPAPAHPAAGLETLIEATGFENGEPAIKGVGCTEDAFVAQ